MSRRWCVCTAEAKWVGKKLVVTKSESSTDVERRKHADLFATGARNAVECRRQDKVQDLIDNLSWLDLDEDGPEKLCSH